jgi:hypothetical protein
MVCESPTRVDSQLSFKEALRASLGGWLKAGYERLDRAIHMSNRQVSHHEDCRCGSNEEASEYDDRMLIDQWRDRHGDHNEDNNEDTNHDGHGSMEHAPHLAKVGGKLGLLRLIYQIVARRAEKPGVRCPEDPAFRYRLERKFGHLLE